MRNINGYTEVYAPTCFFFFFKAIIVMRKVRQEWHESAFNELNITWKNPHSFHLIKYENNGGCTMRIKMRLKIKYILAMWCALSVDFTLLQKIRTLILIFPWTFWRVSNTFFKYAISVIIHHIPAYIWCFLSFEKFSPCFDSKTLAFYMKSTKVYWIWFKLTSFSRSDMYACCWVWWMYVIEKKLWILLIHSHKIQLECLQCVKSFRSTLFAHGIGAHQVENQHAFTKVILTNNSTAFT